MTAYTYAAFTYNLEGGNLAGVVVDKGLSHEDKLRITRYLGYSETVFISHSRAYDKKLEYYTVEGPIDFCGHATLAALKHLEIKDKIYIETENFILQAFNEGEEYFLSVDNPEFLETIAYGRIAGSLGIEKTDFDQNFPIQVVSTGLKDLMVPIKDVDTLKKIKPNFESIKKISNDLGIVGYHLFTMEGHTRNFAPAFGIDEEASTGSSNSALFAYLNQYIGQEKKRIFLQGHFMGSPSKIIVKEKDNLTFVGGCCKYIKEEEI